MEMQELDLPEGLIVSAPRPRLLKMGLWQADVLVWQDLDKRLLKKMYTTKWIGKFLLLN